ncbi:efflux RND transporter periplasmic adaptor subunit [Anaeromyxobacter oryzae]|uniref:Hemolysin D n=1 Tax=Anaeromyxobacter oryzae TaxID=2918170 RepID=A0ABM7WR33_9BACT|nr:efflux RND transporter periplasmic adaptor subunit [Anaeromyxobacter oryzae]BDG01935.1 hemolysin D [Anaeromyxobacter oryzae]
MSPTKSRSASADPKRSIPFHAALAVALLAASCGKKEAPAPPPVPEVTVTEVIQRDVPIGAELTATLRGYEDVEIRARVEGYLRSVDYREGFEVKKGQLLFTIDDQPYRAKLAETKGELARAESALAKTDLDVARFKPLAAQRAISQAELDNAIAAQRSARAVVDAAKALVENAKLDLGYCRITSPVAGLAGQAQRKVGDLVGKGEATLLTTISSIDPIRVSVNIPEALYLKFASSLPRTDAPAPKGTPVKGPGAELVLADGSVFPERGHIVLVDRAVDPQTGTLRADLAFRNPSKLLRPGLYGKVRYAAERRTGALLVPQRAVVEVQGQYSVVVVNAEGKAETRKVKVGPRVGSLWILEEGVKPGEKVIVEGARRVVDGMPVKATTVPAEAAPTAAAPAPAAPTAAGGAGTQPASTGGGQGPTSQAR